MHVEMNTEKDQLERVRLRKQRELKKTQKNAMNSYQVELTEYYKKEIFFPSDEIKNLKVMKEN